MTLVENILAQLKNDNNHGFDGLNIITLTEQEPRAIKVMSEILKVPFVNSKEEFESLYMASYSQEISESDEAYQQRLTKLYENKFIPAVNITSEKKILFCIDPTNEELDKFCNWEYGLISLSTYKDITGLNSTLSLAFDENESMPVYLKKLLKFCHENKATDIDLTTMQSTVSIKVKISGEWTDPIGTIPIAYKNKFLISLCSSASPNPVDYKSGKQLKFRIAQDIDGINILFRIQVFPSTFGENIAIRKLPSIGTLPNLHNLGLRDDAIDFFMNTVDMINSPKKGGMVLITGETGSGKSTLLSAVISEYLKLNKKVNTSEDPVENKHPHPFLNQTEVGEDSGFTHMQALEGFLRLNSDVIVIGECRDPKEFLAVISASLSGHFTYTTYHTGSVEDTLLRIQAMGLDLNLVSGAIKGIVSTNLIPRLCNDCKIEVENENNRYIRNKECVCQSCRGRGVNGVIPVIEAAPLSDIKIKRMIGTSNIADIMNEIKKQKHYISMSDQIKKLKELGLIDNRISDVF